MKGGAAALGTEIVVDGRRVRVPSTFTVAAALLDLGISAFRQSLSGGSRGPVCAMGVCFECRVTINGVPHQRACLVQVADGMRIRTGGAE